MKNVLFSPVPWYFFFGFLALNKSEEGAFEELVELVFSFSFKPVIFEVRANSFFWNLDERFYSALIIFCASSRVFGCEVGWLKSNFIIAVFLQFEVYCKFYKG